MKTYEAKNNDRVEEYLDSCPYCGGHPKTIIGSVYPYTMYVQITCLECGANIRSSKDLGREWTISDMADLTNDVITKWNKREGK